MRYPLQFDPTAVPRERNETVRSPHAREPAVGNAVAGVAPSPDAMRSSVIPGWARRLAHRVVRVARRASDAFPVTPLGVLAVGGAVLGLTTFAYPHMDLVQLVVGYSALAVVGLSVLLVVVGAAWMKVRTRPFSRAEPLLLETRRRAPTGFWLSSLAWLPLVRVSFSWERPEGVRVEPVRRLGRVLEEIVAAERGELAGVRRRIVVEDVFGLARVAVRADDPLTLEVRPDRGALGSMPMLASLSGGDEQPHPLGLDEGDRMELRRYVPGDSARFIHWKIFGRTRRLMVRMPERALTKSRRTVAYLVAGEGDDATAAAARVALEADALGAEWTFSADGAGADATRVDDAMRLLVRSVGARARGGAGLDAFLGRTERRGPAGVVLFVPPRPGEWIAAVQRAVRARPGRVRVVIGTDGTAPLARASWWRRALVVRAPRDGTPAEALGEVVAALRAVRAEIVVLDRRSGKRLGDAHLRAMRALEVRASHAPRAQPRAA